MHKKTLKIALSILAILEIGAMASFAGAQVTGTGTTRVLTLPPRSGRSVEIPISPSYDNELLQLNNLTIQSVTQNGAIAEIIASYSYTNPGIYGVESLNGAMQTTPAKNLCLKFNSQNDTLGTHIECPVPGPSHIIQCGMPGATPCPAPTPCPLGSYCLVQVPNHQTIIPCVAVVGCPPTPNPNLPPPCGECPSISTDTSNSNCQCPPTSGTSYRIEVDQNTRLFLRDRTPVSISDFSTGDTINVFGFYNTDGSVNALIIRDLSKPIEKTFIQLNNVELISISGAVPDATIVVAQQTVYPCYSYGRTGASSPIKYPCPPPMWNSTAINRAAVPQSLMPFWNLARKYEVHIDASTILIDRTRNTISLSDMKTGDTMNIYGETNTANGAIDADVVRDISIPAAATTLNGTITQVNADGSFVMRLDDGSTVTVQNPIAVGARVQITGILDRVQNIISQVSQIIFGNNNPIPVPLPMLRLQGAPGSTGGIPNGKQ